MVRDEIGAAAAGPVQWSMHTHAGVAVDGATAVLNQAGQTLAASIVEPAGAGFEALPANPCAMPNAFHCKDQSPNTGITRLAIALAPRDAQSRVILVQLEPGQESPSDPVLTARLADWRASGVLP